MKTNWLWVCSVLVGIAVFAVFAVEWYIYLTAKTSTPLDRALYLHMRFNTSVRNTQTVPLSLDEIAALAVPFTKTHIRVVDLTPVYIHADVHPWSADGVYWKGYWRPVIDSPPGGESCAARCARIRPRRLVLHDLNIYNVSAAADCYGPSLYEEAGHAPVVVLFHGALGPRALPVNETHVLQTDPTWYADKKDRWWDVTLDIENAEHYHELISAVQIFSHGYYHLITETLPRLLLAKELFSSRPDAKILVTNVPRAKEFLALIGVDLDRVVWYNEHRTYTADILHVPRVIIVGVMHRTTVSMLRRALESDIPVPSRSVKRIVYVHRGPGVRHLDNHVQLEESLRQWAPFAEIVKLTGIESVVETRAIMREASVIIGPHGAGLSHIVFAPASATLIEIMMGVDTNMCFWNLATAIGIRHVLITSAGRTSDGYLHVDNFEHVRDAVMAALDGSVGQTFPCTVP